MIAAMPGAGAARRDLADRDDVEVLVRRFYTRAFADPLLGPIFHDIAQMDLEARLPVMCDFWQTVLFRAVDRRCPCLAAKTAAAPRVAGMFEGLPRPRAGRRTNDQLTPRERRSGPGCVSLSVRGRRFVRAH